MPNQKINSPMVTGNLDVERREPGPEYIDNDYAKTLAHLMGRHASNVNIARVYPTGVLLVGGIDLALHESTTQEITVTAAGVVADLGDVYNFHKFVVNVGSMKIEPSHDGTNFLAPIFPDEVTRSFPLSTDAYHAEFYATCRYFRLSTYFGNGSNPAILSSWKL